MSSTRPVLWQDAIKLLPAKDKDVIPSRFIGKPEELIVEIKHYSSQSKGKSIKLPNGENFFVRDVLEKYDPGHAALPWAAVRLILQMSMNNMDKHAAVLEGIEKISYYLVWSKVEESSLTAPYEAHDQLESNFIQLYITMLTFMARCIRFLRNKPRSTLLSFTNTYEDRIAAAFFSSDSKFNDDIRKMTNWKHSIESCTRQILNQINHEQCAEIRKAQEQLAELTKPVIRVEHTIQSASAILDENENQRILDWASEVPFQRHFRVVEDKALSGTGKWIFQEPDFCSWHNCSRSQILWLHGSSGSGKSTLISLIIRSFIAAHEQLQAPYPMYFFCSRNIAEPERADPEHILRSLMRQASDLPGGPPLHPRLKERFDKRRIAGDVSAEEATDVIIDTIKDRPLTYIVIDALDECNRQSRDTLVDSLKRIVSDSTSLLKIFVTSRGNHQDIEISMNGYPAVCIDASRNQADINHYVQYSVDDAIKRKKLLPTETVNEDLVQRIEESLRSGATGMFRWVELQIKYLCTLRKRSILLERLKKLPPGLEQIYEDLYTYSMKELGEEQAEVVKRILSWLLVSQRPLSTSELCQLVCAPDEPDMSVETVLDMCFDLVRLDKGQDQFRFSHLSVREFLEKKPNEFARELLHSMATCACLSLVTRRGVIDDVEDYAALYWPLHAEDATRNGGERMIEESLDAFLDTRNRDYSRWNDGVSRALRKIASWQKSPVQARLFEVFTEDARAMLLAASFGLQSRLQRLVSRGRINLPPENSVGGTALYLSSKYGHTKNVQILLDEGIDANSQGGEYGSALYTASLRGYADVVRLLLEREADVNAQGGFYGSALQAASLEGHVDVVKLLLEKEADVNAQGGKYGSALQAASLGGHIDVVKLLLEKEADVNAQGGLYGSALYTASLGGYADVVKLLLEKEADVNPQGGFYGSALYTASSGGHIDVVKLLLEKEADVNAQGGEYGSALYTASLGGHIDVVKLLLEKEADVNAQGDEYGNALQVA